MLSPVSDADELAQGAIALQKPVAFEHNVTTKEIIVALQPKERVDIEQPPLSPERMDVREHASKSGTRLRAESFKMAQTSQINKAIRSTKLPIKSSLNPKIQEIYPQPGSTELQNTLVGVGITGLPAGSRVRPLATFTPTHVTCDFVPRTGVGYSTVTANSRGVAVVNGINGWWGRRFDNTAGNTASYAGGIGVRSLCGFGLPFEIQTPDGVKHQHTLYYPDPAVDRNARVQLPGIVRKEVSRTWPWQEQFKFDDSSGVGVCDGVASGIGLNKDYRVGVEESNGDISFRIRTGPIGTKCTFRSRPLVMGDGFRPHSMDINITQEGSGGCRITSSRFTRGVFNVTGSGTVSLGGNVVSSDVSPIMTGDQVILDQNRGRRLLHVLKPLVFDLVCDATIQPNAGGIRVTISKINFVGPANKNPTP